MGKVTYIGLVKETVSSFSQLLDQSYQQGFNVVAVPINCTELPYESERSPIKGKDQLFTYADLVLTAEQWNNKVIAILSSDIDCDSLDADVRKRSTEILKRDISWAAHLQYCGHILLRLKSDRLTNLARIVTSHMKGFVLVQVPFYNKRLVQGTWRSDVDEKQLNELEAEDSWHWWNRFRWAADFNGKLKVVLELHEGQIPDLEHVRRWLGEPLEAIVISTNMFMQNKHNYPVLNHSWQQVIAHFIRNHVNIMLSPIGNSNVKMYQDYLHNLCETHKDAHALSNFEELLQIPLQPLNDNLDCYTYEIFEKDPVKYKLYQDAIEAALVDRVPEDAKQKTRTVIMVLGAGRGPLVRAALNAAENTQRKVRVYIIEKNPNAIRTLTNIARKLWHNKDVQIFSKDMREFSPPEQADILVSELLGSFGDNELSPECLDCAQKLLKPDGISIPCKSISYINPIMSMKVWNSVRNATISDSSSREKRFNCQNYLESGCVMLLKNIYNISLPKPLFEFVHPNHSSNGNSRDNVLTFEVNLDCMVNGFAGYFEAILYNDIMISINPPTHTPGMHSWFPMYFPLTEAINLSKGDTVQVHFWRCVSKQMVWYEWCLSSPKQTHIHNHGGRANPIYCT